MIQIELNLISSRKPTILPCQSLFITRAYKRRSRNPIQKEPATSINPSLQTQDTIFTSPKAAEINVTVRMAT